MCFQVHFSWNGANATVETAHAAYKAPNANVGNIWKDAVLLTPGVAPCAFSWRGSRAHWPKVLARMLKSRACRTNIEPHDSGYKYLGHVSDASQTYATKVCHLPHTLLRKCKVLGRVLQTRFRRVLHNHDDSECRKKSSQSSEVNLWHHARVSPDSGCPVPRPIPKLSAFEVCTGSTWCQRSHFKPHKNISLCAKSHAMVTHQADVLTQAAGEQARDFYGKWILGRVERGSCQARRGAIYSQNGQGRYGFECCWPVK